MMITMNRSGLRRSSLPHLLAIVALVWGASSHGTSITVVEGFTAPSSVSKPTGKTKTKTTTLGRWIGRETETATTSVTTATTAIPHGGAGAGATTKLFAAWPIARDPRGMSPDYPLAATRIAITVASCYLTWFAQAQYSNVMASAALTLVCSMVFDKRLGQAAFCGTFAGMCSRAVIPTRGLALGLGATTALLYEILIHSRNVFLGIGGRLGFTAFLATSAVAYCKTGAKTGLEKLALFGGSRVLRLSALNWEKTILPFAAWHAAGAVATIVLREVSDDSAAADPVRASAVVGLAGALLLHDPTAALAVYGGSFVGMALPSKLMSLSSWDLQSRTFTPANVLSLLLAFAGSGFLGGVVHGATIDWKLWPGGWGGKAGTCAFVGCLAYRGMTSLLGAVGGNRKR